MPKKSRAPESTTLATLDRLVRSDAVRARIDATAARLERTLLTASSAQMSWEEVPLSTFGPDLPESIRSGWVFVLRAGAVTGAERHPNSHQRTLSWRGEGDLQTRAGGRWKSHRLKSDDKAPVGRRWVSIPAGTWHQVAVRGGGHWAVLSFHTAKADELIEERPGRNEREPGTKRRYAGESAR